MSEKAKKFLAIFIVAFGVIVNDCIVIFLATTMALTFITPSSALSLISTRTPRPVFVYETPVPLPTRTPTITPTVEPTITPLPTSTPLPTKDPADTVYLTSILDNLTDMQSDMMQVADGSQQAADNPYIIKTKAWQNAFFTATNDMERASQEISLIDVPVRFAKVQAILAQLYPEVKAMNEDLHKGVNEFDAKWINQGNDHLRNITDIIEKATLELEKVQR